MFRPRFLACSLNSHVLSNKDASAMILHTTPRYFRNPLLSNVLRRRTTKCSESEIAPTVKQRAIGLDST